jgi:putative transposase
MSVETSPNPREALELFEQLTARDSWVDSLRPAGKAFSRRRIYTLGVVIRLMIVQRLMSKFTLLHAVQGLAEQAGGISLGAAAYCRARQKVPTLVAKQVLEQLSERLQGLLPKHPVVADRTIYVLDGSIVTLPHSPELVKDYPPHDSRCAPASHWPVLRLVVLQDVQTGLALCPHWGPEQVSEQQLGLQAIADLPAGAALIGDRNFGIFAVAWAADQHSHPVLMRLTKQRAARLAGGALAPGLDREITWTPSRWDSCGGPYPASAAVTGRLLCVAASAPHQQEPLYLFTTLALPLPEIACLYALRGNVETDLRSLKQTVHLQQLSARSTAGKGTPLSVCRLQSGARRYLPSRREGPSRTAPHQFYQRLHAAGNHRPGPLRSSPGRC